MCEVPRLHLTEEITALTRFLHHEHVRTRDKPYKSNHYLSKVSLTKKAEKHSFLNVKGTMNTSVAETTPTEIFIALTRFPYHKS